LRPAILIQSLSKDEENSIVAAFAEDS